MARVTTVISAMMSNKVSEPILGRISASTLASGSMKNARAKEFAPTQMEASMTESSSIMRNTAVEFSHSKTGAHMWAIGAMIKNMDKECLPGQMETNSLENGTWEQV